MIGRLSGTAEAIEEGRCLLDVNGVGYVVLASARTLGSLPSPPARAVLLIETVVREDAITLYGFAEAAERDWFRLLNTVQGVGARLALGILSALPPEFLAAAILKQDRGAITRAPGVGPKLAARLIAELRERAALLPAGEMIAVPLPAAPGTASGDAVDALSALINLGYRRAEAETALIAAQAALGEAAGLDALIRDGLRRLAR
jgi:Holliday junction DNA helicase RuvA